MKKICSKCGVEKNINEFYSCKNKKDGLKSECKKCSKERREKYIEKIRKEKNITTYKKKCNHCRVVKLITNFHKSKESIDGYRTKCKSCRKKYNEKNKKHISEFRKQWYKSNREQKIIYQRQYREENPDSNKTWKEKNKEKLRDYNKIYQAKYREENKENRNAYLMDKYYNDINFRIKITIRNRIMIALKYQEASKKYKTIKLLGCDLKFYKYYIESLFTNGMSWHNHGEWHIDHIMPCASFDLTKPEEQKACFHYTNTQPLWAKDNLSKGSKIA